MHWEYVKSFIEQFKKLGFSFKTAVGWTGLGLGLEGFGNKDFGPGLDLDNNQK